ncbi:MAG: FeoC-like transcriptional regulator [Magnetococcus sp. WYHC-3]
MNMATLGDLKDFLRQQQGPVPLRDLAHHFRKDPAVMRDMLAHWERKGRVRVSTQRTACQSHCSGCGTGPAEVCEWLHQSGAGP